ncbi:MAG: archaeosortase/exosortase family protein, partial [Planctomycetales bacterium]|nr:archaeosortase/exosortase family protein [Planctomycetales bacterium]
DGWIGVHRWRRHLILAICLGIPMLLLVNLVDLSPWTAATSEYLLRWSGYDAARNGVHLRVGAGPAVRVYPGCSGVEAVSYLFGLAFVCLETFPTGRRHYVWLPIVAALMGFVTNSIRVSLMAILLASDNRDAFTYWHIGEGSQLFGIAAVILLGCIYALTMWLTTASNDEVTVK